MSDHHATRHSLVGRPELWRMKRRFQYDFLRSVGLKPSDSFVDVGCGTLRGGLPIVAYLEPGCYVGIDVDADVLHEAEKELADYHLELKRVDLVRCSELDRLPLSRSFDFGWAFSVLFHMGDPELDALMTFAARHLNPGASLYANANIGEHEPGTWRGFPVLWRRIERYRDAAARQALVVEDLGTLASLGHLSGVEAQDAQHMLRFTRVT